MGNVIDKYLITEAKKFTPDKFDAKELNALKAKFKKGRNKISSTYFTSDYVTIMALVDRDPNETYGWEIDRNEKFYVATHYYTMYQPDDTNPDSSQDFKVPVSKGINALIQRLQKEFR